MSEDRPLMGLDTPPETVAFEPTRAAGLARLDKFVGRTGRVYASQRNYDFGPDRRDNVSALSPWIRHRLITEEEVLRAVLARHSPSGAEKFVQEVLWRGYFKGWLEQRPSVWRAYQSGLNAALRAAQDRPGLGAEYADAMAGRTGIACFDHWAQELVATGYLHNHTRMWFASIWIFTLRLPWELGADFFLRHLLDGDPASNTLSWRWVAGLHTKGKTYLARASNIEKYTDGAFRPDHQLAGVAHPLEEVEEHPRVALPPAAPIPCAPFLLLITEEECCSADWIPQQPAGVLGVLATDDRSTLPVGDLARDFAAGAVSDALRRTGASQCAPTATADWAEAIMAAADAAGTHTIVTAYAPVGPVADRLAAAEAALAKAGLTLHRVRRRFDDTVWPHATRGYFALRKKIPHVLSELGMTR